MDTVKQQGLSGKARRVRYRNRAVRLYTQQLLDELFEPDRPYATRPSRYIPIRGREEFLPSIAHTSDVAAARTRTQLELPFPTSDRARTALPTTDTTRAVSKRKTQEAGDMPLRFPRAEKATASPIPRASERPEVDKNFTIGGFFLGCAMGSAAAALVLLVMQTAIG